MYLLHHYESKRLFKAFHYTSAYGVTLFLFRLLIGCRSQGSVFNLRNWENELCVLTANAVGIFTHRSAEL